MMQRTPVSCVASVHTHCPVCHQAIVAHRDLLGDDFDQLVSSIFESELLEALEKQISRHIASHTN